MSYTKQLFVQKIKENQQVKDGFLVKDMRLGETKNGKPYLSLVLMDNSGEIDCRVWDNAPQIAEICQPGKVVMILAQSQQYKGIVQLKVVNAEEVDQKTIDLADFLPSTPGDINVMSQELIHYVENVKDEFIKKLLMSFVEDSDLWEAFKKAPAAKNMHHAYIGGLLEHTLAICRLVRLTSNLYPAINPSLLLAGAFLHDFGKIKEFSFETLPFNYTDQGRLIGHMVITLEMVQNKIDSINEFPEETAILIKHLVLSHHGRHEYGSPAVPMIREAFALSFLDDFDAKMNYLDRLSMNNEGPEYQWTDYQRTLERFLFVPGHLPERAPGEQEIMESGKDGQPDRQPTLWG